MYGCFFVVEVKSLHRYFNRLCR